MKKKVMATLMAGALVVTATSCSAGTQSAASTEAAHNATVANMDSEINYGGAACETESGDYYYEETTAYYGYEDESDFNTEEYNAIKENGFIDVVSTPLSTFAADVDTGS